VYAEQSKPRRVKSSMNAGARMTVVEEKLGRSSKLVLRGLAKRYGPVNALLPMDLDVASGEFLTMLGPSGSGKTTMLQLVAGLVERAACT
jgi:putative spermidine/putrescine transport system ATP-binding protein